MSDNDTNANAFSFADLEYQDEAEMTVLAGGKPTPWKWRFAGPAHPKGQAQQKRVSAETLQRNKLQEQAQVNRKKWKAPEQSPDEVQADNIDFVLERLLGWNEITIDGQPFPFSIERAREFLSDPKKGAVLQQAVEFILDDQSFSPRSSKN